MATLWRDLRSHHLNASDANKPESDSSNCSSSGRIRNLGDLSWLPERVGTSLLSLLEAHQYAKDLGIDDWNFGIELSSLRENGLTDTDVRWLVQAGLVDFAYEVSLPGESQRQFRRTENLIFSETVCFILTSSGVALSEAWIRSPPLQAQRCETAAFEPSISRPRVDIERIPNWDRDRQELSVGEVIVKRFKAPAANQETILAAFEEEHWPPRIDDPLAPSPNVEPKRRLHDTINSLNRNQKNQWLHFFGDGSGTGVRWEFVEKTWDTDPPPDS